MRPRWDSIPSLSTYSLWQWRRLWWGDWLTGMACPARCTPLSQPSWWVEYCLWWWCGWPGAIMRWQPKLLTRQKNRRRRCNPSGSHRNETVTPATFPGEHFEQQYFCYIGLTNPRTSAVHFTARLARPEPRRALA